jgi:phage protein D
MAEILGSSKTKLGDTIRIQGMPDETLNGEYQVRGIEHFLSKTSGFTTIINCRGQRAGTN